MNSPITIRAKVEGGRPPFSYIWYDDSARTVIQSGPWDTLVVHYSFPRKVSVLAVDSNNLAAKDYVLIYQICNQPNLHSPIKPNNHKTERDLNAIANKIKLYPNPNKGSFTMEYNLSTGSNGKVILYNEFGMKIAEYQLNTDDTKMNVTNNNLSNGIYFYQYWVDNKPVKMGKLIIIK